jgi:fatty-acyl-CoA synthase
MDAMANQVAHWAVSEGLQQGDVVALYMENRLEFVASWLGLCKAGVLVAFINNTIKHQPLVHSVAISKAKVLLFGAECCEAVEGVFRALARDHGVESVCQGGACAFARSVDAALARQPLERPPRALRAGVPFTAVFGYVYTSGTTGLPKAVRVTHLKQWGFAAGYGKLVGPGDVVYSAGMPLYHSSAGGIGTGMVYHYGASQVLRRKFSATAWLGDIRKYRATVCQYTGELCRYVFATPERADDADNTLRLATGNGLSKEIWVPFQTRFGIDVVREFFGSTEGNGAFKNDVLLADILRGDLRGVGCIGRLGSSKGASGQRFCRYDVDADELARDAQGRLVDCEPDEPGECLMPVLKNNPITTFVGYTDAESTKTKTMEDRGVTYFRTGDLLVVTKDRYVRFVDRIGDARVSTSSRVNTFSALQARGRSRRPFTTTRCSRAWTSPTTTSALKARGRSRRPLTTTRR